MKIINVDNKYEFKGCSFMDSKECLRLEENTINLSPKVVDAIQITANFLDKKFYIPIYLIPKLIDSKKLIKRYNVSLGKYVYNINSNDCLNETQYKLLEQSTNSKPNIKLKVDSNYMLDCIKCIKNPKGYMQNCPKITSSISFNPTGLNDNEQYYIVENEYCFENVDLYIHDFIQPQKIVTMEKDYLENIISIHNGKDRLDKIFIIFFAEFKNVNNSDTIFTGATPGKYKISLYDILINLVEYAPDEKKSNAKFYSFNLNKSNTKKIAINIDYCKFLTNEDYNNIIKE